MVGFLIGTTGARQGSTPPEVPPSTWLTETNTLMDAMIATGATITDAYRTVVDNTIRRLKEASAWDELAYLYVVGPNIASTKIDWRNPTEVWTHTGGGSVNFEAYNYWQFDGTSEAELNHNGNTAPLANGDAHLGIMLASDADNDYDVGTVTNNRYRLGRRDGESLFRINSTATITLSNKGSSTIGHVLAQSPTTITYEHFLDALQKTTGALANTADTAELTMGTSIGGAAKSQKKFFATHGGGFLSQAQVDDVVEALYLYADGCLSVTSKTMLNYTEECALLATATDMTNFVAQNTKTIRSQNPGQAHSFRKSGNPRFPMLFRFEQRNAESGATGNRSEIASDQVADRFALLDTAEAVGYFYIETGTTYDSGWNIIFQLHASDTLSGANPIWSLHIHPTSNKLQVLTLYCPDFAGYPGNKVLTTIWTAASAITQGKWHHARFKWTADPVGTGSLLQVWIDNVQVINSVEKLGIVADPGMYFKAGIYKSGATSTFAVWHLRVNWAVGADYSTHYDSAMTFPFGTF